MLQKSMGFLQKLVFVYIYIYKISQLLTEDKYAKIKKKCGNFPLHKWKMSVLTLLGPSRDIVMCDFPPGMPGAAEQPTQGLSLSLWGFTKESQTIAHHHKYFQPRNPAQQGGNWNTWNNISWNKSFHFYNTKLSLEDINRGVIIYRCI